jgi:hypothetical protein
LFFSISAATANLILLQFTFAPFDGTEHSGFGELFGIGSMAGIHRWSKSKRTFSIASVRSTFNE